jgi:hypothetical protein
MSRIDELKKQFPELNMTMFDLFKRIDTSSTYKYFPLLCKIIGKRFNFQSEYRHDKHRLDDIKLEIHDSLLNRGISTDSLTDNELFTLNYLSDYYNSDTFITIKDFIRLMDRNQIENKDVTSYSSIDDLRTAVTLATMKELTKELEGQIVKEFEDEKWLAVRPLTFQASSKYGATTRWCTTYGKEKQYFEKYWQNGILVYFINKQTGYKFAGYKALNGDTELSFWNAEDNRIDYLYVEAEDYLFPIVRRILGSNQTNKEMCSTEIQNQVMLECEYNVRKMSLSELEPVRQEMYDGPMTDEIGEMEVRMEEDSIITQRVTRNMFDDNMERMGREISEEVNDMILNRLVDEARTYHNNTLQGVRDIGISVDENVGEIRYDERPMRA